MILPYGRQNISAADVDAVAAALTSEYLTQGPRIQEFESKLSDYCGAKYAVAVNSATSALHLGCLALGVGPGDLVWTSAISFVASANAARYCGADVDFVDIDIETFNISAERLAEKLRGALKSGQRLPKVVIPVAMAGQSADMKEIAELSKEFGFKILEDASHALGASYMDEKVGSCAYGDIAVFSFHPVKMITTGEGGACLTNNQELAGRIQRLRSHGITRDVDEMENRSFGPWYYEQLELGFNYRITDIQCALGISQLERLDSFVAERNDLALTYHDRIKHDWIVKPTVKADRESSFHLFILRFRDSAPLSRDKFFEIFRAHGILVNLHYIPIYRHPYYAKLAEYPQVDFPNAEKHFSNSLSIPIFPGMGVEQLDSVISVLEGDFGYQTIF
jgi:UDP-4-amino-4,6-dideoxy-N-acetyl-beta-L-altrosamine transaminase